MDAFSNAGLVERDGAPRRGRPKKTPPPAPPKPPAKPKAAPPKDTRTWKDRAARFASGDKDRKRIDDPRWSDGALVVLAFLRSKPGGATWPELDAWLDTSGFGRRSDAPAPKGDAAKKKQASAAKSMLVQCLAYLENCRQAHASGVKKRDERDETPVRWHAGPGRRAPRDRENRRERNHGP